jgi:hypothetical protein
MARPKATEIILSNGDSPEYTRIDFVAFSMQGKILKSFFDLAIDKSQRIFDFQRKCWFVANDMIKPFLASVETLIKNGVLSGYYFTDNRETIESFQDFFHNQAGPLLEDKPKSRLELYQEFAKLTNVSFDFGTAKIHELKPIYRKAAMRFHPDRNNGDDRIMTELNVVWSQIQRLEAPSL